MTYTIYAITDAVTGLQYIGCTKGPMSVRLQAHWVFRNRQEVPLAVAMREHGREAFSIRRLITTENRASAYRMEREAIKSMRTTTPGGLNAKANGNRAGRRPAWRLEARA